MEINEIVDIMEKILDETRTAILATADIHGRPHLRWMTPAFIKGRRGIMYAVTSPQFAKTIQLEANPEAEWMLQTHSLDEVINIRCKINIIDNPSVKNEVLEALGRKLTVFWKVNMETDFIVLETVPEEAVYFRPMKGIKEIVSFGGQEVSQ